MGVQAPRASLPVTAIVPQTGELPTEDKFEIAMGGGGGGGGGA